MSKDILWTYQPVHAATHIIRAADANGFMFGNCPARRFIADPGPFGTAAVSALPGGTSVDAASPFCLNLLRPYLSNACYPALLDNQITAGGIGAQTTAEP